ncbi:MAG: hypothetical protein UH080_04815 [Ruminococcus sp.]|nr:hypothetical protein [Ruminococcus sp.]
MNKQNNIKNRDTNKENDIFELNTFSSFDCTGLIPYALQSDEEIEAYNEMYHFMPPVLKESEK